MNFIKEDLCTYSLVARQTRNDMLSSRHVLKRLLQQMLQAHETIIVICSFCSFFKFSLSFDNMDLTGDYVSNTDCVKKEAVGFAQVNLCADKRLALFFHKLSVTNQDFTVTVDRRIKTSGSICCVLKAVIYLRQCPAGCHADRGAGGPISMPSVYEIIHCLDMAVPQFVMLLNHSSAYLCYC